MKSIWHGYLVYNLGNCVIKLCTETDLIVIELFQYQKPRNQKLLMCSGSQKVEAETNSIADQLKSQLRDAFWFLVYLEAKNLL